LLKQSSQNKIKQQKITSRSVARARQIRKWRDEGKLEEKSAITSSKERWSALSNANNAFDSSTLIIVDLGGKWGRERVKPAGVDDRGG